MVENPEPVPESGLGQLQRLYNDMFDRHAAQVGHVVLTWSRLHDVLGQLFAVLCKPAYPEVSWAIWHSLKSDRWQRDTLREVAKVRLGETATHLERVALETITEILAKITKLEERRNDTVHVAYSIGFEAGQVKIVPIESPGNIRAERVSKLDIGKVLDWYANCFSDLRGNVLQVEAYLNSGGMVALPTVRLPEQE